MDRLGSTNSRHPAALKRTALSIADKTGATGKAQVFERGDEIAATHVLGKLFGLWNERLLGSVRASRMAPK
jgi:hypothetical protein